MTDLIVIPAYNEEGALPGTLASLQHLPGDFEVLVVNDGSRDRTGAVAEQLAEQSPIPIRVIHLPLNSGIGVAVQSGYRYALERGGYRYVIQFDADGQHPAESLARLVDHAEQSGLDLCIGSRFIDPQNGGFQSTYSRRFGIRFFAWLIGMLSGVPVTDPTSGFRCAGPRAWRRFADHYPEDYPEPESLFWCARNGLKVAEIPVRMKERQAGVSSIRRFRAIYYMVKVSMSILFDRIRGSESAAA